MHSRGIVRGHYKIVSNAVSQIGNGPDCGITAVDLLGVTSAGSTIREAISGNIGLGVSVPLKGKAACVGLSCQEQEKKQRANDGDHPFGGCMVNPVNYGDYSKARAGP